MDGQMDEGMNERMDEEMDEGMNGVECHFNPFQALNFRCLQHKSFENTVEKGEITHNEQFLLFPQCFLPV